MMWDEWKQIICNLKLSLDTQIIVIKCYVWFVLPHMWLYRRMLRISWTQAVLQAIANT